MPGAVCRRLLGHRGRPQPTPARGCLSVAAQDKGEVDLLHLVFQLQRFVYRAVAAVVYFQRSGFHIAPIQMHDERVSGVHPQATISVGDVGVVPGDGHAFYDAW